jgi:hypothetical protein
MRTNHADINITSVLWELDRMGHCAVFSKEAQDAATVADYILRLVLQNVSGSVADCTVAGVVKMLQTHELVERTLASR